MERADAKSAVLAIRTAIDCGLTHIDTAEAYGDGSVEELVGKAIAGYRGEVFLASKVHSAHATYAGTLLACEKSLRRLRTDRLDLYLLHGRGAQPLEESLRAFEALREEGKIRAWGLSNFDVADLERAIEIAGEGVIACNQILYDLGERDAEHLLFPVCERHGVAVVAYGPLGSGHVSPGSSSEAGVLENIARARGVSPRAVALAYLTRRPSAFAIARSSRPEQVVELARASGLVLSPSEIEAIEAAFPLPPPKSKMPFG